MVKDGDIAPEISLLGTHGALVTLSALRGAPVVVYFYPKDDTSGCTAEAKDFSALAADFASAGCKVIGISPDSPESHKKFVGKHDLEILLLSDHERRAAEAYGVWVEKSMYGKTYMGVERATFLVNAAGNIAQIWRKVKVPGHAAAVLEAAKALRDKR